MRERRWRAVREMCAALDRDETTSMEPSLAEQMADAAPAEEAEVLASLPEQGLAWGNRDPHYPISRSASQRRAR